MRRLRMIAESLERASRDEPLSPDDLRALEALRTTLPEDEPTGAARLKRHRRGRGPKRKGRPS